MSEQAKRYRAFVSYSQKDKGQARRLHRALERYRLPKGVERTGVDAKTRMLGRFFRDDEEMGAATDLGAALQGAIADAENLIVVCSPNAAQSKWVNEEVVHFKRTGRADNIFAVVVAGTPNSEGGQECFPPALRFALGADGALSNQRVEPLAVDLRKERFERVLTRLVAGLVQTPFDALWKREQRRARARVAKTLLAVCLIGLVVASAASQNLWRPKLETYLRYTRFAHAAKTLNAAQAGTIFQDCQEGSKDCPVMVVIPEGAFLMGSAEGDPDAAEEERPQRQIKVARFAASQREISFEDWRRCFEAGACGNEMPDRNAWKGDDRPVINVSWSDAHRYTAWLSQATGHQYRLLTEAEWEYAARAQAGASAPPQRFSWGEQDPACVSRASNGAAVKACGQWTTWPAAAFPANAFGLHDMHGNVSE